MKTMMQKRDLLSQKYAVERGLITVVVGDNGRKGFSGDVDGQESDLATQSM